MTLLSISLLGPFQAVLDETPVNGFESNKVRALLSYLAVERGRVHPRDALAGLLWPGRSSRDALRNLRYALYNLRNALGDRAADPPFLLITRRTLQFNRESNCDLDVAVFEELAEESTIPHLESAVSLYRGEFLNGLFLEDCPAFEEWALFNRERLQRRMVSVLQRLVAGCERAGTYDQARLYVRQQLELEPWDEGAHRHLMRLLALEGRRGAALAQYETCRRQLREELDVDPTPATTALYERIKIGELEKPSRVSGGRLKGPTGSSKVTGSSAPLVARERELDRLNQLLDDALVGQGRVAFVTGEAGSGKSALMNAFARRAMAAHDDLIVASGNCSAQVGIGDPYLPFREILQMVTGDVEARRAGGTVSREHAERLWAVLPTAARMLVRDGPDLIGRFVPGEPLTLRVEGSGAAKGLDLQKADWYVRLKEVVRRGAGPVAASTVIPREALFEQITRVLKALSEHHPLLLTLDDLQWADSGSVNLLFHLGRRLTGGRLLIVGAYRPGEVSSVHLLQSVANELQRRLGDIQVDLDRAERRGFVDELLDSEPNRLDDTFRETLYRHTGGNPLFTVELLRGLQERGELVKDGAGRWVEDAPLDWERMPARVGAVIAERLGQLSPESRRVLRIASVEGEIFTAEVVARILGVEEKGVVRWLSGPLSNGCRLVHAHSLQRVGRVRLSQYRFRHSLFRGYLYQNLDRVERMRLHQGVGEALEALYGENEGPAAAQIAHHFEVAGMTDRAVDYLLRAGNRAVRLSANDEAIALFSRGLALLEAMPTSAERARRELDLQLALGAPLLSMEGWGASERAEACDRAYELCQQIGSTEQFLQAMFSSADLHRAQGDLRRSLDLGEQMLVLAQRSGDPRHIALAHATLGETCTFRGEFDKAHAHLDRALTAGDAQALHALTSLTGPSLDVMCLTWDAWALWALGYPEQGAASANQAVAAARGIDHPFSLGFALALGGAGIHVLRREFEIARAWIEDLRPLSHRCDLPSMQAWFTILQGWKEAMEGQSGRGIARIREGLALWEDMGALTGRVFQLLLLTEAYRREGQVDEGLRVVDEGLALVDSIGERCFEVELRRLKGELLLAQGGRDSQATACFRQAIDVARRQRAKSWELRAAMSLCRVWLRQGRREEARRLLADVYAWFSEGVDVPDLREARALLETET